MISTGSVQRHRLGGGGRTSVGRSWAGAVETGRSSYTVNWSWRPDQRHGGLPPALVDHRHHQERRRRGRSL